MTKTTTTKIYIPSTAILFFFEYIWTQKIYNRHKKNTTDTEGGTTDKKKDWQVGTKKWHRSNLG